MTTAPHHRRRYERRLREGLCPRCGRRRDGPGALTCAACYRLEAAHHARHTPEQRARWCRAYQQRNRRQGLCPVCAGQPEEGRVMCRRCLDYRREYYARNRERIRERQNARRQERVLAAIEGGARNDERD